MIDARKLLEWKMLLIAGEPAPEDFHMKDVFEITFAALKVVKAAKQVVKDNKKFVDDETGECLSCFSNGSEQDCPVEVLKSSLAPFTEQEKK